MSGGISADRVIIQVLYITKFPAHIRAHWNRTDGANLLMKGRQFDPLNPIPND